MALTHPCPGERRQVGPNTNTPYTHTHTQHRHNTNKLGDLASACLSMLRNSINTFSTLISILLIPQPISNLDAPLEREMKEWTE